MALNEGNEESNVFTRTMSHTMGNISTGSGQPLPSEVVQRLGNVGGSDFSGVRVHTNNFNVQNIGAQAYTQGNDIHFAPGQYNPNSKEGLNLLAHELTHVVQQQKPVS